MVVVRREGPHTAEVSTLYSGLDFFSREASEAPALGSAWAAAGWAGLGWDGMGWDGMGLVECRGPSRLASGWGMQQQMALSASSLLPLCSGLRGGLHPIEAVDS